MTGETMKVSRMLPALVCGLALMGSAAGLQAGEAKVPPLRAVKPKAASPAPHQKGTIARATYYADRYHGRKTSSGEIYDSRKLTAAHPTMRLGTKVKVVNLANQREVVVKVNDRLRKRRYEIIDLSRAAAQELDFIRQGKIKVRILPVEE